MEVAGARRCWAGLVTQLGLEVPLPPPHTHTHAPPFPIVASPPGAPDQLFIRARRSACCPWQVYAAAARMEWRLGREQEVARKLFEKVCVCACVFVCVHLLELRGMPLLCGPPRSAPAQTLAPPPPKPPSLAPCHARCLCPPPRASRCPPASWSRAT